MDAIRGTKDDALLLKDGRVEGVVGAGALELDDLQFRRRGRGRERGARHQDRHGGPVDVVGERAPAVRPPRVEPAVHDLEARVGRLGRRDPRLRDGERRQEDEALAC